MTSRTPILFVSHEGTRTGAPMMLLHFVRWLRDNSTIEPEMALLRGGPLADDFAEVGPTTVLGDSVEWPGSSRVETATSNLDLRKASMALQRKRVRRHVADLRSARIVYLNSSASVRLLHHLPNAETAIAHIHELESALRWSLRPEDQQALEHRIDHVVAAADCVAANLTARHRVSPDRVTRVYEFIDTARVLAPPHQDRDAIRAELGLGDDAFVIGGSGFADWRKGIDLFVQLANDVVRRGRSDVHFVWVGDRPGGAEADQLDFDLDRTGLRDRVHMVGLKAHSFDWYRAFDVFALTSREDPYPLVGLETALLEVPMVCFDDAGGMTELVTRSPSEGTGETGVVVPYVDVEAMAEAALALLDDPDRRAAMGQQAARIVHRDHEVNVAGPQVLDVIERVVGRTLR